MLANLKKAARDRETLHIGGGEFPPAEVKAFVEQHKAGQRAVEALKEIHDMLKTHPEAKTGNSKVHYCMCRANTALRGEK